MIEIDANPRRGHRSPTQNFEQTDAIMLAGETTVGNTRSNASSPSAELRRIERRRRGTPRRGTARRTSEVVRAVVMADELKAKGIPVSPGTVTWRALRRRSVRSVTYSPLRTPGLEPP
jgi:hypothetical protein